MPQADGDSRDPSGKMSAEEAGYMELEGAEKDGDCSKVSVDGGISKQLGCCNEFDPQPKTQQFSCGTCTLVLDQAPSAAESGSAGGSQPVISGMPG